MVPMPDSSDRLADAVRKALPLLEQVDKHLDPFPGQTVKLWKRLLIDEMRLHLARAMDLLREALPQDGEK